MRLRSQIFFLGNIRKIFSRIQTNVFKIIETNIEKQKRIFRRVKHGRTYWARSKEILKNIAEWQIRDRNCTKESATIYYRLIDWLIQLLKLQGMCFWKKKKYLYLLQMEKRRWNFLETFRFLTWPPKWFFVTSYHYKS